MATDAPAAPQVAQPAQRPDERYKVRFPTQDAIQAALGSDIELPLAAVSLRRRFISLGPLEDPVEAVESLDMRLAALESEFGAKVVVDRQYEPDWFDVGIGVDSEVSEADGDGPGLDDVLTAIRAREAWDHSRGTGVTLAIVDTGVDGSLLEFVNRADGWGYLNSNPWEDLHGHGTMVAAIAAASRANGGDFDGVAPDATIYPCRTTFVDGELTVIYERLAELQEAGPVVVNNSWGIKSATAPLIATDDDFPDALSDAVAAGVIACFSAGNYHALAGGGADACNPTSIWAWKGREDVLTTAAIDLHGAPWPYSSRGPGQHISLHGYDRKPDVSAPVPENGLVLRPGGAARVRHWGTSGASPQTAGLAALIQDQRPRSIIEVKERIAATARGLEEGFDCVGAGQLDCLGALS